MLTIGGISLVNTRRYRQIANILIKYGFGYLIERIGFALPRDLKRAASLDSRLTAPQRVVKILEELGPTFIKMGQILSTRPDIIPKEYIDELKKLQDNVEAIDFKIIRAEIERELSRSIEDVFTFFDEKPIAAASIGQVHRGTLKNGKEVVVKIKRPAIDDKVNADLEILTNIARLVERHIEEVRIYEPVEKIEEFSNALKKELDFTQEGWNIEKFKQNFRNDTSVYVPEVFWEYTTKRILTIEHIKGIKVNQVAEIKKLGLKADKIAENGAKALMKQIFVHGFFHGDPHPGNILICLNGKIAFIDFGMMGRIDKFTKGKLAELIVGLLQKDPESIVETLLEIGVSGENSNLPEFELDIEDIIERYYGKSLKQINISDVINEMFYMLSKHKITIPSNFTLLLKSMITIEGVGRELDPDFNVFEVAKPFVDKLMRERYNPKQFLKVLLSNIREFTKAVSKMPEVVDSIIKKMREDTIKLDIETEGSEKLLHEINKMVNRLVFSLIVASLIIGTSLIIQANIGPFWHDVPIIALLSFTVVGVLGLGLVISILRSGKL